MTVDLSDALTLVAAIGAGLMGGVFFAFSTFVTAAFRSLPPEQGMAAMQAVNRAAPSPPFMVALLGTFVACVGVAVAALTRVDAATAPYQLAGAALYLVTIVTTVAYHVPRNDALAGIRPATAGAGDAWTGWLSGWRTGTTFVR